jgi:hypothetical protein
MSVEEKEHYHREKTIHELEIEAKINERLADLDKRLLTAEEIVGLRKLMEQDARARWFWASLRTWILAISATIALLTVGFDGFRTILRRLIA